MLTTMLIIWAGLALAVAFVAQPLAAPVPSTPAAVDPARLQAHVKKLSVDFYPRSGDQIDKLNQAADYIAAQLKAAGGVVSFQEIPLEGEVYRNVIAHFGPSEGPLMVIGAHYDSHGMAGRALNPQGYSPDTHTPGADDNASGVAGLIELARLLGREAPTRPVELVAYTLEEPPYYRGAHMGSVHHAKSLRKAGREVSLMLSLEMIGYFTDAPGSQSYPAPGMRQLYSDKGNFIALVNKFDGFGNTRAVKAIMAGATDLPVYSVNAPRSMPGIDFSDHRSYWDLGMPAMMITDTAFMRNRHYHKAGDTHDRLDYVRMAKVVQAVHAVTRLYHAKPAKK
jgi:Zn-dependent M28 family amino/carboxypeptidase